MTDLCINCEKLKNNVLSETASNFFWKCYYSQFGDRKEKKREEEEEKSAFYSSRAWLDLRYQALIKHGRKCQCCGSEPPTVVLHVDHIKPRSLYPELELQLSNLQILCKDCNFGKSNKDDTDFRPT